MKQFIKYAPLLAALITACAPTAMNSKKDEEVWIEDKPSFIPESSSRILHFKGRKFKNFHGTDIVWVKQCKSWVFVTDSGLRSPYFIHVISESGNEIVIKTDIDFGGGLGRQRSENGACIVDKVVGEKIYFRRITLIDPLGDGVLPQDRIYILDLASHTFGKMDPRTNR
jgi:hypothetical protein